MDKIVKANSSFAKAGVSFFYDSVEYNLDYSEIYFENEISTSSDPMGVNQYIISGQIIGKKSISKGGGPYYPLFRIENYRWAFLHNIIKWFIIGSLLIEVNILNKLVRRKRNDT